MGLLIKHENNVGYNVLIREEWMISSKKEARDVINELMELEICFKINYEFESTVLEFKDETLEEEDFTDFSKKVQQLMNWKNKYGKTRLEKPAEVKEPKKFYE